MANPWMFLEKPGVAGVVGALMDEYARAADDFTVVVEALAPARWEREIESKDPDTRSLRRVAEHAVRAAWRYADYIREARGLTFEAKRSNQSLDSPLELRPRLAEALRYTEGAFEGLYGASDESVAEPRFTVRWGPVYDPEMLIEHAIVHLLRHRRQVLRFPV